MARPYELLARFLPDGTIGGAHVKTLETVNGRDYESDPVPLSQVADVPQWSAFAAQFSAAVVTERDTLQSQVTALTSERDSLQQQVAALQAQLDAMSPQPSATQVWPREFMQRFTLPELVAIQTSSDPGVILARTHLQTTVGLIDTQSAEAQQLIGLIVQAGLISADRATAILTGSEV